MSGMKYERARLCQQAIDDDRHRHGAYRETLPFDALRPGDSFLIELSPFDHEIVLRRNVQLKQFSIHKKFRRWQSARIQERGDLSLASKREGCGVRFTVNRLPKKIAEAMNE